MDLFNITPMRAEDLLLERDPAESIRVLQGSDRSGDPQRLKEAAKRFEGLFVNQILKQMKETAEQLEPEDEESDDKAAGEHIKSMFWTFLGDAVTEQGGFGLWEQIYEQMASARSGSSGVPLAELDERI